VSELILPVPEETKARIRHVIEYATAECNHYDRAKAQGRKFPKDDPAHIVQIFQYRCAFSISIDPNGKPWRHVSISVPEKGQFAAPIVALNIAQIFGFTGWDGVTEKPPQDWTGMVLKEENAVLLFQEFKGVN
jgi:hypothetical protein